MQIKPTASWLDFDGDAQSRELADRAAFLLGDARDE